MTLFLVRGLQGQIQVTEKCILLIIGFVDELKTPRVLNKYILIIHFHIHRNISIKFYNCDTENVKIIHLYAAFGNINLT